MLRGPDLFCTSFSFNIRYNFIYVYEYTQHVFIFASCIFYSSILFSLHPIFPLSRIAVVFCWPAVQIETRPSHFHNHFHNKYWVMENTSASV